MSSCWGKFPEYKPFKASILTFELNSSKIKAGKNQFYPIDLFHIVSSYHILSGTESSSNKCGMIFLVTSCHYHIRGYSHQGLKILLCSITMETTVEQSKCHHIVISHFNL